MEKHGEKDNQEQQGKLIVFSAPSGSGKTTIVRHLLAQEELNLEFSISATSREPRGEEKEGVDYYFIDLKTFKNHIKADEFLEWEEVYRDNFYGTLWKEVRRIWALGKHVIFDIDVVGGLRIKKKFPEKTLAVFVKPPSVDELKIRLKKRSTESEDKINMRIAKASVELATAPQFDHIILNDNLDKALAEAEELVSKHIHTSRSTMDQFKKQLASAPQTIQFKDVIALIEKRYTFTPTAFTNGDLENEEGQNNGSCKIFAFASKHSLNKEDTLQCFGEYYRKDVLENPEGEDHQNIRNFMKHGWEKVRFSSQPLQSRK